MADASSVALRHVEEVTRGTTPASALQILRKTGDSLKGTKETIRSEEHVGDAQVGGIIEAGYGSAGSIEGELSFGTYDDFIGAAIRSVAFGTETSVTAITIAATATEITDSGSGFGAFTVGQFVKVSGFTASSLNRVYLVTSAAAGALGVYPDPATTEAAGESVTVSGADIFNGTQKRWFSIEKEHTDLTNVFFNYLGCGCGGMELSWGAKQKVEVSFPFMGNTEDSAASTIGTGGPTAATTTEIMNSISDLVIMGEGTTHADITVMSGNISIANPLRSQDVAGSIDPFGIGMGTVQVSGQITVYLADASLKDKFHDHTKSALVVAFQDTAGNAYGIYLPAIQYTVADSPTGAGDTDIVLTMNFEAYKDPTTGYTAHITKMAA